MYETKRPDMLPPSPQFSLFTALPHSLSISRKNKTIVTIHGPAEKRSSANSNTLRDAQKRQKTPLIVVENLLFIASSRATRDFRAKYARKYLAEYGP